MPVFQRVAVCGAGAMGAGIAQLLAQSGFSVKLYDSSPEALCRAAGTLKKGLDASVLKGKLTTLEAERAARSVAYAKAIPELDGAEIAIEAIAEDLPAKRELFKALASLDPDMILATNTSSLPVSEIAEVSPERSLGLHFFNPPAATKLVEVVKTPLTRPEIFKAVWEFVLLGLRRTPVEVGDTPGFIVNRVMRPYYLECQKAASRAALPEAVDRAARERGGVPMGPFELMDLIGLDVNLAITKIVYGRLGRPERLKPQPLQERLVSLGRNGRKSGRGFYLYKDGKKEPDPEIHGLVPESGPSPEEAWERVLAAVLREAAAAFEEGVAGKADIDMAIKLAMNFPKGPFEWLKERAADPLP